MSCSRGNTARNRPQKHQNRTAFKNDLHDTSKKTKFINGLDIPGLCERCRDIIDWKIKYKKYKPLSAPSKCVNCSAKAVKYAYHMICGKCVEEKNVCAKCLKVIESTEKNPKESPPPSKDLATILKEFPEEKQCMLLRFIEQENIDTSTPELAGHLEKMMATMHVTGADKCTAKGETDVK